MPTVGPAARQTGSGIAGTPEAASTRREAAPHRASASPAVARSERPDPRRQASSVAPAAQADGVQGAVQRTPRDAEFERWRNAPAAWLAERLAEAAARDAQTMQQQSPRARVPESGQGHMRTHAGPASSDGGKASAATGQTSAQTPPRASAQNSVAKEPQKRNPLEGAEAIARRLRRNEERLVATEEAVSRYAEALADARHRANQAEGRLAETHSLVGEARRCANEAQSRLADMQERLDKAERRAEKAEQQAQSAQATRADIEERAARAFAIMKERIAAAEAEADAAQEALTRHQDESRERLSSLEAALASRDDALARKDAEVQARINDAQREAQARIFSVQARLDIAEIRLAKAREALEAESLTPAALTDERPPIVQGQH